MQLSNCTAFHSLGSFRISYSGRAFDYEGPQVWSITSGRNDALYQTGDCRDNCARAPFWGSKLHARYTTTVFLPNDNATPRNRLEMLSALSPLPSDKADTPTDLCFRGRQPRKSTTLAGMDAFVDFVQHSVIFRLSRSRSR